MQDLLLQKKPNQTQPNKKKKEEKKVAVMTNMRVYYLGWLVNSERIKGAKERPHKITKENKLEVKIK